MIDQKKRKTLKNISAIAAGSAAAAVSNGVFAGALGDVKSTSEGSVQLRVHSRVSVKTNDVEVVLTNVGEDTAFISELTPAETVTKRGRFNFAGLMTQGDLRLEAGQSVSVPMIPHPVVIDASDAATRSGSLIEALKKSMTAQSRGRNVEIRVMDATLFA